MTEMLSLLTLIPGITNLLTVWTTKYYDTQVQLYQAKTGVTREVAVASIQQQAAVQSRWWFAALPPALIGFSVSIYLLKVILWDKVIGAFMGCYGHTLPDQCTLYNTDPLGSDFQWVMTVVIGSYFGYAAVTHIWGDGK